MTRSPAFRPSPISQALPKARVATTARRSTLSCASTTITLAAPRASRCSACCGTCSACSTVPVSSTARTYMPGISTPSGLSKRARSVTPPVAVLTETPEKPMRPGSG